MSAASKPPSSSTSTRMLSKYRSASRSRFSAAVSSSSSELPELSGSSARTLPPSSSELSLPDIDSSRSFRRGAFADLEELEVTFRFFDILAGASVLFRFRCEAGVVKKEDIVVVKKKRVCARSKFRNFVGDFPMRTTDRFAAARSVCLAKPYSFAEREVNKKLPHLHRPSLRCSSSSSYPLPRCSQPPRKKQQILLLHLETRLRRHHCLRTLLACRPPLGNPQSAIRNTNPQTTHLLHITST